MLLAVTHIHTRYSYDSIVNPARLVDRLAGNGVQLALVADHDSFEGSLAVRDLAAETGRADLLIPIAAEINTDRGDVIFILDRPPVPPVEPLKHWPDLVRFARERGGMLWLPHPYQQHRDLDALADEVDVIEVFNARCRPPENLAAEQLCRNHGKTPGFGADAHVWRECFATMCEYPDADSAQTALRAAPTCLRKAYTPRSLISASQVIKGLRLRQPGLVVRAAAGMGVHLIRETCMGRP